MVNSKRIQLTAIELSPDLVPADQGRIEELASSILKAGICFPPLVVRRLGDRLACHRFKLLSGHQQYYAAQKANLKEINALIIEENDTPEIETAILSQIQSNSTISEVTEAQNQEQTTEPLAFDSPASNSNGNLTKTLLQQLLEQNQAIFQSLKEMEAALVNINAKLDNLPLPQVSPPTPTTTLSGSSVDGNQPQLKIRLLNQGSRAEIEQWLINAGVGETSRRKYIKEIIEFRTQSPFQSLIHLKEILNLRPQTLTKLEKCPVPASLSFLH
ncbi:ParB N-terminal domain-containing protein [Thermosynechococcus sp. TA-1]|uniref:ParB N-terminal domain-containing protein n=1 Tax=Thermosynechococcus sp. TA-1 TaxID=2813673 RepID=UPI0019803C4C|nr:ParB N-terminal domain-containing protein [Thermosynechococcus sp. TA-1]QSF48764.1 ParB N-terminal domain-containing protein [Thermosynechococcus sp. TA-1]